MHAPTRSLPRLLAPVALLFTLAALTACGAAQSSGNAVPPAAAAERAASGDAPGEPLLRPDPVGAAAAGEVDYTCRTDADCAVKDVGNCCGYYPACVNKDSPTFPEQVKAECEKQGRMAVCGFPEIAACQCVQGRCAAAPAEGGEVLR